MAVKLQMWADHGEFTKWLHEFPRQMGFRGGDELYNLFRLGVLEDDADLWEWAQFWGYEASRVANRARVCSEACVPSPGMSDAWGSGRIDPGFVDAESYFEHCHTAYDLAA